MPLLTNKKSKKQGSAANLSFNPDILDVNLVKDEVAIEFNWKRHIFFAFIVILLAAALVAEIYYGLNWWQKKEEERAEGLKAEYAAISRQIKNINANAKDFVGFRDKLTLAEQLIDNHIYWTNFFNWLEKNTLNSVNYVNFDGDVSGDYIMSAQGKKFSDVSWQTKSFKDNPMVTSVRVDSGISGKGDERSAVQNNPVLFDILLKVKPEIFYTAKQVSETSPQTTNTPVLISTPPVVEVSSSMIDFPSQETSTPIQESGAPTPDVNVNPSVTPIVETPTQELNTTPSNPDLTPQEPEVLQ